MFKVSAYSLYLIFTITVSIDTENCIDLPFVCFGVFFQVNVQVNDLSDELSGDFFDGCLKNELFKPYKGTLPTKGMDGAKPTAVSRGQDLQKTPGLLSPYLAYKYPVRSQAKCGPD